uniref:Uncharacterized protein n=1 Tax=Timema shepardi TaxID=629360 RepID=A0A7R9FZQ6_TIMSH|nr:unnamed protein product [Timema shepardi]
MKMKSMKLYPGDLLRIGNEDDVSANEDDVSANEDDVSANEDVTSLANLVEETDESFFDLEKVTFILYDSWVAGPYIMEDIVEAYSTGIAKLLKNACTTSCIGFRSVIQHMK